MNRRSFLTFAVISLLALSSAAIAQDPAQAPDPARVIGPPAGAPLSGEALEKELHRVASVLRCPVCQGLSVWDSPAPMAVSMKGQTRELLARGYNEEQILNYFEKSYGEFVRLEPTLRGMNWLVWIIPMAFALGGGFFVWRFVRKSSARQETSAEVRTMSRDALPEDAELARWVLRAREVAYGWPGGVSPASQGENR